MKYIRFGAMIAFVALLGTFALTKSKADSGPVFFYSDYLSSGNGDYSHRTVDLDHTYYSANGTHADSLRGPLYFHFYETNTASPIDRCVMNGSFYFTTSGNNAIGGNSVLTSIASLVRDQACGGAGVSISYRFDPIDIVRPLALQTAYSVGGDIRSDADSESYLDFLCAYGSNWSSNAGSYNFSIDATVTMDFFYDGSLFDWASSSAFRSLPGLTVNLHCHLK